MGQIPGWLLRHTVTVEAYEGEGAHGPVYAAGVSVRALVRPQTRMVRAADGREVVSSSSAFARRGLTAPPGSRVTLPDGRTTTVIAFLDQDGGGLPTPDHVEIQLA
jgi:hypothetical protein